MDDAARFRCMCGNVHSIPRESAMDGIGVVHWRCTYCRRRFVLAHAPPDSFTPIYLDAEIRSVEPRETGTAAAELNSKNPMPPPAITFRCRCGEKMTAHSWMYGGTAVCHGCKTTLYLVLKYHLKLKVHVIVPEYPPKTSNV